ncbi:MAG: DUF4160 domain-containing protein [Acidobacteria bacterium]|nr:DUF4160 domain-containing protein [Acidobacteriota bacterium]
MHSLIRSRCSRTALRLIEEWVVSHRAELEANWDRIMTGCTAASFPTATRPFLSIV